MKTHGAPCPQPVRPGGAALAGALLLGLLGTLVLGAPLYGCRARTRATNLGGIDAALGRATRYLLARQGPDGAWRSEIYGGLRDGVTLTPPVVKLLYHIPERSAAAAEALRRGADYMAGWVGSDGRLRAESADLAFPVYAGALGSVVSLLGNPDAARRRAGRAWLDYLEEYRLGRSLGWVPGDPGFGGWGYAARPPRKAAGQTGHEANVSATLFGLLALRQAGVSQDDPRMDEIRNFFMRCQNYGEPGDARLDDGGFFFTPCDPPRNKAGSAGRDRLGRERFHSYGSATADGLRGLVRTGLGRDHPRARAASGWLETHFSTVENPGRFLPDREVLRGATYYYYTWSVAHAFSALGIIEVESPQGRIRWARALSEELLRRQNPDGSWNNRFTDAKEDDPLVATPLAAAALALCRQFEAAPRR